MTTAAERLLTPGPEEEQLAERAGTWNVAATMWPEPGAEPVVTSGLIADRTMIGLYLQEIMRPGPGGGPDFRRIDYLSYDRVEGRWKYVSMDGKLTRSDMLITRRSASHELKQQHFISADGTGRQWLAVQYEYRR